MNPNYSEFIRTNPIVRDLLAENTRLERIATAAQALIQYDKAVTALSEGSDEGSLGQAQRLFEASFDALEAALTEYAQSKRSVIIGDIGI